MIAPRPSSESQMLHAALRYAAHGWSVFPLAVREKVPMISKADGGRGHLDATTDRAQVLVWWTRWPHANIGIATGHAFDVLDVDPRHEGDVNLAALEAAHNRLPVTVEAATGGGGRHVLFLPDTRVRCSEGSIARGLDVKAKGGYVVAPPSVHPDTGQHYAWDVTRVPLAPWPEWLLDLAVLSLPKPRPRVPVRVRDDGRGSRYGLAMLRRVCEAVEAAAEGMRHVTLRRRARAVGGYVATGELDAEMAYGCLLAAALASGLPEREAVRTLDWAFLAGVAAPLTRGAP